MKIAAIEPAGRLYGSEYCLLDIIRGLKEPTFQWTVILPASQGFDRLLELENIATAYLIPRNLHRVPKFAKAAVYTRVLAFLAALKPDIIYVNQTGSLRSANLYARLLKIPIACQVQTLEDAHWLSGQKRLQSRVRAFICNSEFIANQTDVPKSTKSTLYQGMQDTRLKNAIANSTPRVSRSTYHRSEFKIGVLGRIAKSKGHFLLLECLRKHSDTLPPAKYYIIGEGLTDFDTNEFKRAIKNAGLSDRFVLRGYQPRIKEEIEDLDLLLIPSLAEPLGRVLFDAAEHCVPVVVSDAGGLGEISKRFNVGIPFQSGDSESLAIALRSALENLALTQKDFVDSAIPMMRSLDMNCYLECIHAILLNTKNGIDSSVQWLGKTTQDA